jgi:hypothetical protein
MYIVLAKLLWAFDILPPLDDAGNEVHVDTSDAAFDSEGGLTTTKVYNLRWKPRNGEFAETVIKEAKDAKKNGYLLRGVKVGEGGVEV